VIINILKMTFFRRLPSQNLRCCILPGKEAITCCGKNLGMASVQCQYLSIKVGMLAGHVLFSA